MPITKTMAYKVGNETFATFEEAQIAAISDLFKDSYVCLPEATTPMATATKVHEAISGMILDHADELVAIIACKPEEEKKPRKPRKDKGTKRANADAINRELQDMKQ